ncbi:hypothetical protein SAMD00019534_071030, partial [Acytostelium subglobosum LB1]|uniref:hypothetical protein n=1 Tax=Acytostelium subglobosum LB1 TaxID=1410327 RepID=UPI000644F53C
GAPNHDQKAALDIINIVMASLSMIGSLLTIISYLRKKYNDNKAEKEFIKQHLMKIFAFISLGTSFVITLSLVTTNSIVQEPSVGWCELKSVQEIVVWFLPLTICMVVCIGFYIKLKRLFREKFEARLNYNERLKHIDETISKRLTLYILVFIIVWLPDIAQHILSYISTCSFYPLMVIQNLLVPSQGFCNFWVYSYTSKISVFSHSK